MSNVLESPVASVEPAEKFYGQREWEQARAAKQARSLAKYQRQQARKAELMRERANAPLPIESVPVGEIAQRITALGLPGDPYPDRTLATGAVVKACGRFKQKEALRRRQRLEFMEELKTLPIDQPLPIALTAKAEQILVRRSKKAST